MKLQAIIICRQYEYDPTWSLKKELREFVLGTDQVSASPMTVSVDALQTLAFLTKVDNIDYRMRRTCE